MLSSSALILILDKFAYYLEYDPFLLINFTDNISICLFRREIKAKTIDRNSFFSPTFRLFTFIYMNIFNVLYTTKIYIFNHWFLGPDIKLFKVNHVIKSVGIFLRLIFPDPAFRATKLKISRSKDIISCIHDNLLLHVFIEI